MSVFENMLKIYRKDFQTLPSLPLLNNLLTLKVFSNLIPLRNFNLAAPALFGSSHGNVSTIAVNVRYLVMPLHTVPDLFKHPDEALFHITHTCSLCTQQNRGH